MLARALLVLLAGLPLVASADDERVRIAVEREALTARFAQEELECAQRFAVNDCLEDVRRRRRDALEPLRAREFELDDAERLRRAAERRAAIEARQRERDARPPPPETPDLPPREPAVPASAASAAAVLPRPADTAQERALQAQERVRSAQRRREEAAAAQERVQSRLREREAAGKTAAPLPVPASAPAK
jgi:hypothetical protein